MKTISILTLLLVILLFGVVSPVGAQNSESHTDLARLCVAFLERWQAAGGADSGIAIPDWCNPNTQQDDSDNACAGGLLDARCETDWEWICGYYLQQWEDAGGWNGNYAFPDWCDPDSLLPPRPGTDTSHEDPVSLIGCYNDGTNSFYFGGTSPSPIEWHDSVIDCSGTASNIYPGYDAAYVFEATEVNEASQICATLYPPGILLVAFTYYYSLHGFNSPPNLWGCAWIIL